MAKGAKIALAPQTTIKLKMLLPTTLLMAKALLLAKEAVTLTAHSGRLVPMATMVKPMIIEGIRNFFATELAPSTK